MLHTPGIMWHDYSRCYLDLNCGNITTQPQPANITPVSSPFPPTYSWHLVSSACFPVLNVLLITAHWSNNDFFIFPHSTFWNCLKLFFNTNTDTLVSSQKWRRGKSGKYYCVRWRVEVEQRIKHGLSISMVISINPRPLGSSPDLATRGGNRLRLDNTQHR